jgi:hypothetical protein
MTILANAAFAWRTLMSNITSLRRRVSTSFTSSAAVSGYGLPGPVLSAEPIFQERWRTYPRILKGVVEIPPEFRLVLRADRLLAYCESSDVGKAAALY